MKRPKFRFGYTLVFLLLALLIHLFLLSWAGVLNHLMSLLPGSPPYAPLEVDLWPRAEAVEEEKTPEEELADYEPEEEVPEGQVVETPPTANRLEPLEKPRFLSEQDSRADQESQSIVRTPGEAAESAAPAIPGQGVDQETMPGGMREPQLEGAGPAPEEIARAERGDLSARMQAPPSPEDVSLSPSLDAMAKAVAGTGLDHLEDVIEGDSTALNTSGWDHASFFNRVKQKVEQFWHPDHEYKKRDPYGNIYGFKDRVTVLLVVLHPDGSLKHLYVMDPSGASFLDDEAYEAVQQAAPFPNVPPGLRDRKDGLVKFTFHFIVEVGSQPVFRMRRYK
jgi:TonB family protein